MEPRPIPWLILSQVAFMKGLTVLAAAMAIGSLARANPVHGGAYLGPSAGGSSPGTAGPSGGGGIGGASPAGPLTPLGGAGAPDLSLWSSWWEHNKAPYLELKSHVYSRGNETGSDGWFLGQGEKQTAESLRPTEQQIRGAIVPALLSALERETNNDIVTGCLVALAKIGDDGTVADALRFEAEIARFLSDPNQEIRETAAVALGILANPRSIPALSHLLWDTEQGRALAKKGEVDYRMRSFAAYGLGLIGARTSSEGERSLIVSVLGRSLQADDTRTPDLQVAALIALSIVPLARMEAAVPDGDRPPPPESSRLAQLETVRSILRDPERHVLVRAQCPIALARLLQGLPAERFHAERAAIAEELIELVEREQERDELIQSCVLALGLLGTNDGARPLDVRIRKTLAAIPAAVSEPQARGFALIAMAKVGARPGAEQGERGIEQAKDFLLAQLVDGKHALRPWAGLACGVLCRELARASVASPAVATLQRAVRTALEGEVDPSKIGAYAIAEGLMGDRESTGLLLELLAKGQDDTRGQVAIGLALMDAREAIGPLRGIVMQARYRPELLRNCAIALGILGDKDAVPMLVQLLKEARSLTTQASLSTALGFIGDQRSIAPLIEVLGSPSLTERARAFAAVALGNAADKELLPWNSKLALDLNYRAATATLTEPLTSTGILDIL